MEGKVCIKCGVWKALEEYHKKKDGKYGRSSKCKECKKEYDKEWRKNNKEHKKEYDKQWHQSNPEYNKQWRENNPEYGKQWRENNPEYGKQWRENNPEYGKQYYETVKQNNLQYISSLLEQINPMFKQLNLQVYGYVYMFENVKTGHVYIGQTINPLKERYRNSNIVQGWVEERLKYDTQKFKEELIKEDIVVTEVLDVAFCQYHLDKLEAYYIDKYNSFLNGYNNREGNHNTDDGIEEFNQILLENNLEFIDGKLVKIA